MIAAYYDTNYLFKLQFPEDGSSEVQTHAASLDLIACSLHGRAELLSAAHRKFCEGVVSGEVIDALINQIEADTLTGSLFWLPITDREIARVEDAYQNAPSTFFLRAADALHLSSAAEQGFSEIYSNDRHLLAAAGLFGLRGVNVIR